MRTVIQKVEWNGTLDLISPIGTWGSWANWKPHVGALIPMVPRQAQPRPHTDRPKTCGTLGYVLGFCCMVLTEAYSLHVWVGITLFLLLSLVCSFLPKLELCFTLSHHLSQVEPSPHLLLWRLLSGQRSGVFPPSDLLHPVRAARKPASVSVSQAGSPELWVLGFG